ncbi:MAG TPA: hypothetical protein VI159_06725 [Gemmatimonadales bacterium]
MRIAIDPRVRADHGLLRSVVWDGFEGVETAGVEVRLEPAGTPSRSFAGRAYASVPRFARAGPDVRYLVRLFVPTCPRDRGYPRTYRYRRLRTAPWITVGNWREALVALSAHEACHVRQFRDTLPRSEVEAERWSKRVLTSWASTPQALPVQLALALR